MFLSKRVWTDESLRLSEGTLAYVAKKNFVRPTTIQESSLIPGREGKNLCVESPTGSGKTLAYLSVVLEGLRDNIVADLDKAGQKESVKEASISAGYSVSSSDTEDDEQAIESTDGVEEKTTGSGATFRVGAVIVVPTHELANQVYAELNDYLEVFHQNSDKAGGFVRSFYASTSEVFERTTQRIMNTRSNLALNVVVGTAARLEKLFDKKVSFLGRFDVDFNNAKYLVIDEADKILQNVEESLHLKFLIDNLPKDGRKTYLFSATIPRDLNSILKCGCTDPVFVRLSANEEQLTNEMANVMPNTLDLRMIDLHESQKLTFLIHTIRYLYKKDKNHKILVFCLSNDIVNFLYRTLKLLIYDEKMFGEEMSDVTKCFIGRVGGSVDKQTRGGQIAKFTNAIPDHITPDRQKYWLASFGVLISTDLVGRGIDFGQKVTLVISYECANKTNSMSHRGGRTARADKSGTHLVILSPREVALFKHFHDAKGMHWKPWKKSPMIEWKEFKKSPSFNFASSFGAKASKPKGSTKSTNISILKKYKRHTFVYPDEQNCLTEIERYEAAKASGTLEEGTDITPIVNELQKRMKEHVFFSGNGKVSGSMRLYNECKELLCLLRHLSLTRREFFTMGEKSFIDHLNAYDKHDLKHIFISKEADKRTTCLPIGIIANAFGLVKLPRIKEIKGLPFIRDFSQHKLDDYLSIEYHDPQRNKVYLKQRDEAQGEIKEIRQENAKKKQKQDKLNNKLDQGYLLPNKKKNVVRRQRAIQKDADIADLMKDALIMKKAKQGRMTEEDAGQQLISLRKDKAVAPKVKRPKL